MDIDRLTGAVIARCGAAADRAEVVAVKNLLIVPVGRCMLARSP
jgi:hypothetical protein